MTEILKSSGADLKTLITLVTLYAFFKFCKISIVKLNIQTSCHWVNSAFNNFYEQTCNNTQGY
jgi:hypothetical protein